MPTNTYECYQHTSICKPICKEYWVYARTALNASVGDILNRRIIVRFSFSDVSNNITHVVVVIFAVDLDSPRNSFLNIIKILRFLSC